MARTLVAAAVQPAAHSRASFREAWRRIAGRVREAAASGAQLVVLPEGTLPAYVLGYEPFEPAEVEEAVTECGGLAKSVGIVLVAGAARYAEGRVYNSAMVFDADGSVAGSADKHFLWHFDRQWFAPGERIAPVRTSIGNMGVLVCADGRIPTIARTLVDQGAELLVMPTAWVTSGRDPQNLENVQADLLARVRARENGVPFIAANKCGTESGCVAYCGKSQIIAADGTVLALASQSAEETIVSSIEIGSASPNRAQDRNRTPRVSNVPINRIVRVAITARAQKPGDDLLLRILEADVLVSESDILNPGETHFSCAYASDETVLDPGALAEERLDGRQVVVWRTAYDPQWQLPFARARALELRMYLIAIDSERARAYAVDPDGTVVCGTFDGYEIASFLFDPTKTQQTAVAPGTDVLEGLLRVQTHALD